MAWCDGARRAATAATMALTMATAEMVSRMKIPSCTVISARICAPKNGLLMNVQNMSHF